MTDPISRWSVSRSYAWCRRCAQRSAGNFYHAFRLLPREQLDAMCGLYAFSRITDDLGDEPRAVESKREALSRWKADLHAAAHGQPTHPSHPAICHVLERYSLPIGYLEEIIQGVEMDLDISAYPTFNDLYKYCYRVASAVGLACIHIWGFSSPQALAHAEAAGLALQLTNILRDLAEDAARGRVYLPLEDLDRFDYPRDGFARQLRGESFRALMDFESRRAYEFYDRALALAPFLPCAGRAVFLVMVRTYRALLDAIVRSDYDVFSRRARPGRLKKLWLATRALPVRWGWLPY